MLSLWTNWCMSLSRSMIVNYESLQQHEGGALGLQLLVDKEGYDLAGQSTEAVNKSHSPALAALAVLKGTVQLPELCKNRPWLDSKTVKTPHISIILVPL